MKVIKYTGDNKAEVLQFCPHAREEGVAYLVDPPIYEHFLVFRYFGSRYQGIIEKGDYIVQEDDGKFYVLQCKEKDHAY